MAKLIGITAFPSQKSCFGVYRVDANVKLTTRTDCSLTNDFRAGTGGQSVLLVKNDQFQIVLNNATPLR